MQTELPAKFHYDRISSLYVTEGEILMTKFFFSIQTFLIPCKPLGIEFSGFKVAYVLPKDASYLPAKFHED